VIGQNMYIIELAKTKKSVINLVKSDKMSVIAVLSSKTPTAGFWHTGATNSEY
jgi:hypothetical protein